jgi:hypothetical protein
MTIKASSGLTPGLHPQAGYKTAVAPPRQNFNDPLATREASI